MPKHVTIEFPFPEMSKASIHGNGNRYAKAKTIKQRRSDAAWRVFEQYPGVRLTGRCEISYRFFVPNNRQRDEANMIQMCKPFIDGLVDAKLIGGDNWQRLSIVSVETMIDKDRPRVELVISEEI